MTAPARVLREIQTHLQQSIHLANSQCAKLIHRRHLQILTDVGIAAKALGISLKTQAGAVIFM